MKGFKISNSNFLDIFNKLGSEGNIELLLYFYKKENTLNFFKDEIELALFNSVDVCVKNLDFEKLKLIISDSSINKNLRFYAKIGYDKKKWFSKSDVLEVPRSFSKIKKSSKSKKLKNT